MTPTNRQHLDVDATMATYPGLSLTGKVAVVTGGHRGIGASISVALASAGAIVAIGSRHASAADDVVREVAKRGGAAQAFVCDVSDPQSMEGFASAVGEVFGVADIVVANAGLAGPMQPMHQVSLQQWRECTSVNLDGVFLTFKAFLPSMLARDIGGSLIAIGSITGKRPLKDRTPYAASKMGVVGLVRTLAEEVGPSGIRVNIVSPGAVDGPRFRSVLDGRAKSLGIGVDAARAEFVESTALRRLPTSEEVAGACVFLASDAAGAVTGVDLNVACGVTAY